MKSHTQWLRQMTKLNPAVNKRLGAGNERFAPHKPLLLLCVLELVEQGLIQTPELMLSADLVLRFQSFWKVVVTRWTTRPDLRMPFHHLGTQGFWQPLTRERRPSEHRQFTEMVALEPSFLEAMGDPEFRATARAVLITNYFPQLEQIALHALTGTSGAESNAQAARVTEEASEYAKNTARDARFRIQVVSAYSFTCALTGYRLTTVDGGSIVDAAHIHERRDSLNDDPGNGLALSKNAHWMFDEGLWSITDDLKVMVAENVFADSSPDGFSLKNYQGRPLFFQKGCALRPVQRSLGWHRENKFQN